MIARAQYYVETFFLINSWREVGDGGLAPLSIRVIEGYERRYGMVLSGAETQLMKELDDVFLAARNEWLKKKHK